MLSKKMQKAMNDQINAELYSGYLYLAMSNYFKVNNLTGMGNWMKVQAGEELGHAMKFLGYIHERSGEGALTQVDTPPAKWDGPLAVFQEAYKHELLVTARINKLVELAQAEKDYASVAFLTWFVTEQVEEEASALEIVEKLKLVGNHPGGLYMLDRELGMRSAH